MDNLEVKDVKSLGEIEVKIKELKPKESLYLIEFPDVDVNVELRKTLAEYLRKHNVKALIVKKMPTIKELKRSI